MAVSTESSENSCSSRRKNSVSTILSAGTNTRTSSRNSSCFPPACCSNTLTIFSTRLSIHSLQKTRKASGLHFVLELHALDLFVQGDHSMDQRLGARRAAGHIHVHRHHLIHPLHHRIVVEDAAARSAITHGDHPLRLRHLVIQTAKDG